MAHLNLGHHRIYYSLEGEEGGEVVVFVNGLTQSSALWLTYQKQLVEYGYRVLLYDMPGQGQSSKPVLYIPLGNQTDLLENLLEALNIKACHVAGISFGGVVGLLAAIRFPDRIKSLVAMSTFSEMPSQLVMLGAALHSAITQAGFPLVQALLLPMNLSSAYVEKIMPSLNEMVRRGYAANDPYAIQNLMESFVNFKPFTEELKKIKCPTLILNGEFDYLTPRLTHDIIRRNIPNSRLLVFPKAFHAFTLENPTLTIRILEAFVRETLEKKWKGDQSVWIASEDPTSEVLALRFIGDHLRAVFMPTGPGRQQTVTIDEWKAPLPGSPRRAARARKPAPRPPQAPKAPKRGGKPPAPTPPKPGPKGSKAKQPS